MGYVMTLTAELVAEQLHLKEHDISLSHNIIENAERHEVRVVYDSKK